MLWPYQVVEALLADGRERDAETYVRAFLKRRPAVARAAAAARRAYAKSGLPRPWVHGNGYADEIAALQVHYALT